MGNDKAWKEQTYWEGVLYKAEGQADYKVRQIVIRSLGQGKLPEPVVAVVVYNENGKAREDGTIPKYSISSFLPEDLLAMTEAMTASPGLLDLLNDARTAWAATQKPAGGKGKVKAGTSTASGDVDGAVDLLDSGMTAADVIKSGFAGPTVSAAIKVIRSRRPAAVVTGSVTVQP